MRRKKKRAGGWENSVTGGKLNDIMRFGFLSNAWKKENFKKATNSKK